MLADGNTNLVHADFYRDDAASIVGEHRLEDYGEYIAAGFHEDETLVVDDYRNLTELSEDERAMYEDKDITAWIGVPLYKEGELSAFFIVTESEPRAWTDAEVAMVEETADRTWAAVERARTQEELRENEAWLSEILAQLPVAVGVIDIDGVFELQNDRMETVVAGNLMPSRNPAQQDAWIRTDDDGERLPPEQWPGARALRGEDVSDGIEFRLERDETSKWMDVAAVPLRDDGDVRGAIVTVEDITERKRAEQARKESETALKRLNAATRELIDADSATIGDLVAELVLDVLDVEYATLWRYDETAGELDEYASRTNSETAPDAIGLPIEFPEQIWQTFIGDDVDVDNDVDVDESESAAALLRSRVFAPLGRHGVICAGSVRTGAFEERKVNLVETIAATVETAWDSAEGEAELERQNTELIRLDRLNTLIREIDNALVQAETVDAIDEAVCDRLAESAMFEFAWIGEFDADAHAVSPRAWAGIDGPSLEELTTGKESVQGESPPVAAIQTGDIQVVADVATDARATPWREATLERGGRSWICIPLVYDESVHGVLAVYGGTPQPDKRDIDVLSELGGTIAHAIHTVETRVTQRTDSVVELTLQTSTAETPLIRLTQETGGVIEFEGLVPEADGDTTVFFTARDVSPDEVMAAGEQSLTIKELVHLADRDDGPLFKVRLAASTLAARFLERGATIRSLTIEMGTATAVVVLPETADVREFVEGVKQDMPDIELLARRSQTRSLDTAQRLQTAFEERLTPRQQEILQLAYRSGYFESPRIQTGKDLSAALDISQSTFNHHLRGAERTLLEVVFDHT